MSLAQREGVDKVYTLVERDEVATWVKLGFAKEGNIPGFYKRSDAFLLGCAVPPPGKAASRSGTYPAATPSPEREAPPHSERIAVAEVGERAAAPVPMTEAQEAMERIIVRAKKTAKDLGAKAIPSAKIATVSETEARKAVQAALRSGRALTGFEPFGRDVERRYFLATARGGFELYTGIQTQACFGNAYIELLQGPWSEPEGTGTIAALKGLCDKLLSEEVVSCFALAPSDDLALAVAFVHNGFRRTGLLMQHLVVGNERKDAILWSRKLANPADE